MKWSQMLGAAVLITSTLSCRQDTLPIVAPEVGQGRRILLLFEQDGVNTLFHTELDPVRPIVAPVDLDPHKPLYVESLVSSDALTLLPDGLLEEGIDWRQAAPLRERTTWHQITEGNRYAVAPGPIPDRIGEWGPADPARLEGFWFPDRREACFEAGGCVDEHGICRLDCEVALPTPAIPPRPPDFSCAPGWVRSTIRGVDICRPWDAAPLACGANQIQLPGSSTCVPIQECGSGPWPVTPMGQAMVRVGPGGDYPNLQSAILATSGPTVFALTEHEYVLQDSIPARVEIHGLCPDRSQIEAVGETSPVVQASLIGVRIQGVILRSPKQIMGSVVADSEIDLKAQSTLRSARFTNSPVTISDAAVVGGEQIVMDVSEAAPPVDSLVVTSGEAHLRELVLCKSQCEVRVTGGSLTLESSVLRGAVRLIGELARAEFRDVAWLNNPALSVTQNAFFAGYALHINGAFPAQAPYHVVNVGTGASATLYDSVLVADEKSLGRGLNSWGGSTVRLERAVIVGAASSAARGGFEGNLDLNDVLFLDTGPRPCEGNCNWGAGLVLDEGGTAEVHRLTIRNATRFGVSLLGCNSTMRVCGQSTIEGEDLIIEDTQPHGEGLLFGSGLHAGADSIVRLDRVLSRNNRHAGFLLVLNSEAHLRNVIVEDTQANGCGAPTDCAQTSATHGIIARTDCTLDLQKFHVRYTADTKIPKVLRAACGLSIVNSVLTDGAGCGTFRVEDGIVEGHPSGLCIHEDDFRLQSLGTLKIQDNDRAIAHRLP